MPKPTSHLATEIFGKLQSFEKTWSLALGDPKYCQIRGIEA